MFILYLVVFSIRVFVLFQENHNLREMFWFPSPDQGLAVLYDLSIHVSKFEDAERWISELLSDHVAMT